MAARNTLKATFKKKGYVYLPELLGRQAVELFTQYALFREGFYFTPENDASAQVLGAHSSYGDPFAESILVWAQEPIEAATGLRLLPTYSYYRVYRSGHSLAPHKDRPSCEISATICFEYQYQTRQYEWPIKMDGTDYVMKPGDAIIYRGCELEHSRETMDAGKDAFHVQAFVHYVDADGPNCEYANDGRVSLAMPPPEKPSQKRPYIFSA